MPEVRCPVFTIGHSTRSIADFVEILRGPDVQTVVDVRTVPRSRTNPQFNFDILPGELAPFGIAYERIAGLGGLRGRSKTIEPEVNAFWNNRSFHNYADHALSGEFREGFDLLVAASRERRTAIMCAEAVWWRCHRRIIADYLILHGIPVVHLMDRRAQPAQITPEAQERDGRLIYPA